MNERYTIASVNLDANFTRTNTRIREPSPPPPRKEKYGLPAAWMTAKFSSRFLYGIHPHDLATFTLVPVLLAFVALLACWIPARRAARVDPQTALRRE